VLADCTAVMRLWDGGLVFYGGVLAAALVAALWAWRRGWAFGRLGDVLAPSLALGHALGRLGCFAAGCCYGRVCLDARPPCVSFPPDSVAYQHLGGMVAAQPPITAALHPTQLYEAAGELAIFFGLLVWRRRQRFHGELLLLYALAYALLRAGVEVFRGDVGRRFLVEAAAPGLAAALGLGPGQPLFLSVAQALSVVVGATALALFVRGRRRTRRA
jgi:phosphatidylglycerol:prolipoprotein diacylglycerol transferase